MFAESILNNLEEIICLFNKDGRLIFANKTAEEFFHKNFKELKSSFIKDFFYSRQDIEMLFQKTITQYITCRCKDIEISIDRHKSINTDIDIFPFYLKGNLEGAIMTIKENLDLVEKTDYQFDNLIFLLGSIAHEVRNPLSGIKGAAQILKQASLDKEKLECINLILKETDRLNSVLQNYLSIAKTSVFNIINIYEIIEHSLKVMKPEILKKNIKIERNYDLSIPDIYGDESKILQVTLNILKNAIESMNNIKNQKSIIISTKLSDEYMIIYEDDLCQKDVKKQRWLIIDIKDTGIGIPKDKIDKIFLPFFSDKKGGSGLGLSLSRKIVKDHNGFIKVKSFIGKGSLFSIYLPVILRYSPKNNT